MPDYPTPCDGCTNKLCEGKTCERWQIRYRYRQKQINAYAKRIVEGTVPRQLNRQNVWRYLHPDETRAFLATDPCKKCLCRNFCNGKCRVKDSWKELKGMVKKHERAT